MSIGVGDDGAPMMFCFSAYDKMISFPGVPSMVLADDFVFPANCLVTFARGNISFLMDERRSV